MIRKEKCKAQVKEMNGSTIFKRNERIRMRRMDNSLTVILNETIYQLNEIAELILKKCNGKETFDDIVNIIADTYDAPEENIKNDCMEMLKSMIDSGMVTEV